MNKVESIISWSKKNPWPVIAVAAVVTAFFSWKTLGIRVDASASRMMVEGDPDRVFYEEVLEKFGSDNTTVIYIKDNNLWDQEKLKAIENVYYSLYDIKNVSRVDSIFNAKNFKGVDGALETNSLMDPVPEDINEITQAKKDAIRSPLMRGTLISKDGKILAISVVADPDFNDENFDEDFSDAIDQAIKPLEGVVDEVFQIGTPYTRKSIVEHILQDQFTLVPLGVLILLVLLVIGLKTIHGAVIPVITGGVSVIWTTGFMVMNGIPIHVLTVIVPSLLLVLGATEDMHMISEYFDGIEEGKGRLGAIDYMAKKVSTAIALTAFTTFAGFASIILNDMTLLREFGIASSFGLFMNFWITVSLGPAFLALFGEKKSPFAHQAGHENAPKGVFYAVASRAIEIVRNKRPFVFGMIAFIFIACIYGVANIKVDNDLLGYFKKNSDIRIKADKLHEDLAGAQTFFIILKSKKPGAFKEARNLQKVFHIQKYIDDSGHFDNSISLANNIALVNREMNAGKDSAYLIPAEDNLVSQYLLFFTREDIERYVTADYEEANIVVRHNLSSSHTLKEALSHLNTVINKELEGTGITHRYTSEGILINNAAESIAVGQVQSLGLLALIIFVIMCALFVNLKAGFLSLIPNLVPIAVLFGVMGIFDIPLNPGTAMIAAIAIGIAVDDTIHFMVRYNSEMKIHNDQILAMESSLRNEVRPMMTTSVALALGFGTLGLSNFVPLIYFGLLSSLVMIWALIADLVVTPSLLVSTKLITLWDMLALNLKEKVIKESLLFKNMTQWQIKKIVLLGHTKTFNQGDLIIKQGEMDRKMYLLLEGGVSIERVGEQGKRAQLGEMHHGEVFGEIALVDSVERTADVIAIEDNTQVLEFDWESLERIKKILPKLSSKLFLNISRILGKRLAAMDSAKVVGS